MTEFEYDTDRNAVSDLYAEWIMARAEIERILMERRKVDGPDPNPDPTGPFWGRMREIEWQMVAAPSHCQYQIRYKFEVLRYLTGDIIAGNRLDKYLLRSIEEDLENVAYAALERQREKRLAARAPVAVTG